SLVRAQFDGSDILRGLAGREQPCTQRHSGLHRGLRMELRRITDLEENILHYIRAVSALKHKRPAAKEHIVKSPTLRGQHRGITYLSRPHHEGKTHSAACGIAGCPTLARPGVGGMAIR